jgi:cellulose synthase/poly-beta-1,6-N-acetylglucosamine synthase-like glycosyltransferase
VLLTAAAAVHLLGGLPARLEVQGWAATDDIFFVLACAALLFGNVVHQLARLGLARRLAEPQLDPEQMASASRADKPPPLVTILVPAYKEEPNIVLRTLLSGVCQTYPNRRVVLLLDDPPRTHEHADERRLAAMRAMPTRIADLLQPMRDWVEEERTAFQARRQASGAEEEIARLVALADAVAFWLDSLSEQWADGDHTERFFSQEVVRRGGRLLRERVRRAADLARAGAASWSEILVSEYDRLSCGFGVEVTVFERRRYANLSHDANKAMNLNSYIACLGRNLAERRVDGVLQLNEITPEAADLLVPASPYVLTLDADSVLLPEYAERLVGVMERPGNERLAVLQTPYASFPGATAPVERIAGATTDVQLLLHQGYSHFGATFWVGANALIRRAALDDIAVTTVENGHPVTRYVQDRTVIEDTESTLDLVRRGWSLHNHPERLAYSATPPDFGTLVIQRRRWACGGLLILPKLFRRPRSSSERGGLAEFAIRFHYLASLAYGPVAVLLMLLYPFDDALGGLWLPLTALPYFLAYGRDLAAIGYRWRDLGDVYALNLLLVPVHLAGTVASLRQALTRRKTPFRRTPKVAGRTIAPKSFVLVAWGLPAWCGMGALYDLWLGNALHAAFAGLNGALFVYAAVVFVGPRASLEDLLGTSHRLVRWLGRDRRGGAAAHLATRAVT